MKKFLFVIMLGVFTTALSAQNSAIQVDRRPISPDAQTQAIPAKKLEAKGATFSVKSNGDKALVAIDLEVTCDFFPGEATYNVWSFDQGAYLWAVDHEFTGVNETIIENLSLEEGDYSIDCFDTFGDGGIAGTVTDVATNTVLASWFDDGYAFFGEFQFTAAAAPLVPLSNWAFALIGFLAVGFVFFKFRK